MTARRPDETIVCRTRRTQKSPVTCLWCGASMTKLCDFPVASGEMCNVPMCETHARPVAPNVDFCPSHVGHRPVF